MATVRTATPPVMVGIWERLQLHTGLAGSEGVYSCRVADIHPDRLMISRPIFDYGHSLLAHNRRVDVTFTRADAAYTFTARLRESEPRSPEWMFLTELGEVNRFQRRRFVRLDISEPVGYQLLRRPLTAPVSAGAAEFRYSRSINISAGGMLLLVSDDVKAGDLLLLDFTRASIQQFPRNAVAVCRHLRPDIENSPAAGVELILSENITLHVSAGETTYLPEEATRFDLRRQNALVAELFTLQVALRQKGLL